MMERAQSAQLLGSTSGTSAVAQCVVSRLSLFFFSFPRVALRFLLDVEAQQANDKRLRCVRQPPDDKQRRATGSTDDSSAERSQPLTYTRQDPPDARSANASCWEAKRKLACSFDLPSPLFTPASAGQLNSYSLITHASTRSMRESDRIAKILLSERVRARESGHITEKQESDHM